MTLGQRISYLRERRSLSQSQLAKEIHVATSTLGMWETDKRRPSTDALLQLADYFNVTTDYILGRKTDLGNVSVAAHYTKDFDDFTDAERQEINDYIEFKKAQYKKRHENENKD